MSTDSSSEIAILGCGGFIGSHLLECLLRETDYRIEGIDTTKQKIAHLVEDERFTFHKINIQETDAVIPIIRRCKTVISLAALCNPYFYTTSPIAVIESNFINMWPIVKTCSDYRLRLIHFSTSEVYGRTLAGSINNKTEDSGAISYALHETTSPLLLGPISAQRWCYASAKQLLERTIFAYGFERDLDYTIVRPFNFIGPGMDYIPGIDGEGTPRVFACFMDALLKKKPLLLVDGGNNQRCFTAIDDAIDALLQIIIHKSASRQKIFNIGNPANETTIKDLARRMINLYIELNPEVSSHKYQLKSVASKDFYGNGYEDSDRRLPAIDSLYRLFGWQPKLGLDATIRMAMIGFIKKYQS